MKIFCCACQTVVEAGLVSGKHIYPDNPALHNLPFYRCHKCGLYVGCHYKTRQPNRPLGVIPTPALRRLRQLIHNEVTRLTQNHPPAISRLYKRIAKHQGIEEYHTGLIKTEENAQETLDYLKTQKR